MATDGRFGLVNAGYRAIESCRLEKGYRAWGSDIGPDHTPVEAGLSWAVKMRKNTPFKGREVIERQLEGGVKKMLVCLVPENPDIVLLGRETIYRDGKRVGWLSSGGFGYTIGKPIGYGYVRNPDGVTEDFVLSGTYELDVACERVPCKVSLKPLYDPEMKRVRA
jgi:4-methylaminobutanoate oxidase (formaldehyde-forming)